MHVLVVGAGIVGAIYGWALAESGHHVVHLVRSGRAAALSNGLAIDLFDKRKGRKRRFRGLYRLTAVEALTSANSLALIIVPTKHYALEQTLGEIVPQAGAADFLLLTQNWHGTAEIDAILPRSRYVYGDAKAGGAFSGSGLIGTLSAIDIGPPEGKPSALAKKAAGLFASADIKTSLHADMLHYLWIQYAITGGLWAALIHAGSFDSILTDHNACDLGFMAVRESLEVVRRRGVVLSQYPETAPFLTNSAVRRRIYRWVMAWMFRHDEYTKRCSGHAFGDPTEVKTFYEDLLTTGRDLGMSMRAMESYAEAIKRFTTEARRRNPRRIE
ncbi:MAG: 2-dehydropantoate 2-reductase N-terminal domain-containing protein [Candidatus Acidiferrales bacterium]